MKGTSSRRWTALMVGINGTTMYISSFIVKYDDSLGQNLDKIRTHPFTWILSRSRLRELRVCCRRLRAQQFLWMNHGDSWLVVNHVWTADERSIVLISWATTAEDHTPKKRVQYMEHFLSTIFPHLSFLLIVQVLTLHMLSSFSGRKY